MDLQDHGRTSCLLAQPSGHHIVGKEKSLLPMGYQRLQGYNRGQQALVKLFFSRRAYALLREVAMLSKVKDKAKFYIYQKTEEGLKPSTFKSLIIPKL